MGTVFFDLEWNQGYPRSEADKIDEIIQIGAYRLQNWQDSGDAFSAWVKPNIHRRLHHHVRKLVPLEPEQLNRAGGFRKVAGDFFRWCGRDATFYTWGTCDARVLDTNLCWYGMEEYLDFEFYDLQRAFDLLVLRTIRQTSLEKAVELLGLEEELQYHDAGNDAYYTARIGAELVRRYGALPEEAEMDRMEAQLRTELREQALQVVRDDLAVVLTEETPVFSVQSGNLTGIPEALRHRAFRTYRCPRCDNQLCSGNWYRVEDYYLSRARCSEHGKFLSVLTFRPGREDRLQGRLRLYPAENLPDDLFQHCRQGGERIEVGQMPRAKRKSTAQRRRKTKRKHTRKAPKAQGRETTGSEVTT